MSLRSIFFIVICQIYFSCGDPDTVINPTKCSQKVVVNENQYNQDKSDQYEILSASIESNCLNLEISSSGCDGSQWSAALVDKNAIAESSPEQRFIRLVLNNNEECDAIVQRVFHFEITELQIENNGRLILNIQDFDQTVIYDY